MSIFHHCREYTTKSQNIYSEHAHTRYVHTSRFPSARHVYFIIPIVLATLTQFLLFQLLYETKSPYNSSVSLSLTLPLPLGHRPIYIPLLIVAMNVRIQRVHLREKLLNHSRERIFFLFFLQMTSIIFDCFREYFFINNGYFALKIALNVEPSNGSLSYVQCPLRVYK